MVTEIPPSTEAAIEPDSDESVADPTARPDEPSLPLGEWIGKNLFSNLFNAVLTVAATVFLLVVVHTVVSFIFGEDRNWDGTRTNLRLLFTLAYPEDQYVRVWFAVGTILALAGLTLGIAKRGAGISVKRISLWFLTAGSTIALSALLARPAALRDSATGELRLDDAKQAIRQSYGEALVDRGNWWILAAVSLAVGLALWFGLGDLKRRTTFVPTVPLALAGMAILVSTTWWYGWGHYGIKDGEAFAHPGELVAATTRNGWTIMWLVLAVAFLLGTFARRLSLTTHIKPLLLLVWLLSPFVIYWVILRDPDLDWDHIFSTDIPLGLAFALLGGALLWLLTRPGIGELGRIIAALLVAFALFNWVAAFFGWYAMLQKVRISFLMLALAALLAPNFIGEAKQRMRLVWGWIGFSVILHYFITVMNSPSTVETQTEAFGGGFMITLFVAVLTTIFSFPLGVLLALGRTSRLPIFRMLSTTFIEVVRGIPFITVLVFFATFLPLFLPDGMTIKAVAAAVVAFTLFSAAYLAENVRGGLQSVRQGQYEASDALGLTTVQRTGFIVLPQALRVSIPPLVGQMIATYKETSLLFIISIFDFLMVARNIIPNQQEFRGDFVEGMLFVSLIYWIGAYAMSKYSQRLEKQLGVGAR